MRFEADSGGGPTEPDGGVGAAARALRSGGRVALAGAWGAGKTTLLDGILPRVLTTPACGLLRITTTEGDQDHPYGALAQMLSSRTPADLGALPPQQARLVDRLLHRGADGPPTAEDRLPVRLALTALLAARDHVLAVDGVQWLDPASADALGYALRTLPAPRLLAVVTERTHGRAHAAARLLGGHPPQLDIAPFDAEETAALLDVHGLPTRWAAPLHRHCGGHRLLTAVSCAALARLPPSARHRPVMPPQAVAAAGAWLRETLTAPARRTLTLAALTSSPSPALLLRAGRPDAEEHLAQAVEAGVLRAGPVSTGRVSAGPVGGGPAVRFAAAALAEAAARCEDRSLRTAAHRTLARAVGDPVHEARHRALAQDGPDQGLAEDTELAAAVARDAGERALAAELLLLAAEITPLDRAGPRVRRLTASAREAAAAGATDIARQAADAVLAARAEPAHQVAALLALVDAHGQALAGVEPLLARCRELASGHPDLLAAVELRAAIAANIAHGAPAQALRAAARAAELARTGGDRPLEAAALTMRARMERVLAVDDAPRTLAEALALGIPAQQSGIRNSAQYLAARHAVFDDRLHEARERLTPLLALAEHEGEAEDLVDIWRSLAEVDVRLGACAPALAWADQAVRRSTAAALSMGPAWYTAALTQSAAGSFAAALRTAACGARASREEGDGLYVVRNLWITGAVLLHTGEIAGAAAALAAVDEAEGSAPSAEPGMFRWQPDAVEAFAHAGLLTRARYVLDRTQDFLGPPGERHGTGAALTRARGILLARTRIRASGTDEATDCLRRAATGFERLGLPLERARTLLALGRVERSRRRQAAARTAWETALAVFEETGALPWQDLTRELLARAGTTARRPSAIPAAGAPAPGPAPAGTGLTESEARLAALVRRGATNQDAARHMFLSVKTVEGMLSRIYRKLGVRSRTQLAALAGDPAAAHAGPAGAGDARVAEPTAVTRADPPGASVRRE
ncbi:LuxR family transcriptional regulator [Streptomyces sp. G-G2]|uniref:helix-turn-helix transcriptional regulator n=1 Tax=Streptomyces sp. G-G2 TaxID=3046201 RepID=UPI0024B97C5E|nr:LuxR family transcriptional regulator [Streptomyces sp. G-G2]MDJ0385158.1 LuxR family transcriptional regulator [Streptomyces sp. G-G2]